MNTKRISLLVIEGACVEEHNYPVKFEFSVVGLLKHMGLTLDNFKPKNVMDASAIEVVEGEQFTSIQLVDSEGEFTQYIGLSSDYVKRK